MEKVEFKLIKEFGPSILKVKIPNDIINKLSSVNNNFRNAFDKGGIRENIKKNIKLLNSDLSYFKLF